MPMKIICRGCGTILYEGAEIKSPYEIAAGYDGKCPKCARKLSQMPKSIEVRPVNTS
jgi:hypothetical protein